MESPLKPRKRKALLAKSSRLWRKAIELLQSQKVQKNSLNAFKLALSTTRDVADAFGCAPLKGFASIVLENCERCELSGDVQEDLVGIAEKIERMVEVFDRYQAKEQEEQLSGFMSSLTKTVDTLRTSIETKLARGRLRKVWEAPDDAKEVARMLRVIDDNAESFLTNITLNIDAQVKQVDAQVKHVDTQVKQVLEELKLFDIAFIKAALYQTIESNGCTPGTRVDFIDNLRQWSIAPSNDVPPVCWIYGHAGVGKTTIMHTMSSILHRDGLLGGSFFCARDFPDRRSITNIFPTIAQSLAIEISEFRSALITSLSKNRGADSYTPDRQFDILISEPARDALARSKSRWQPKIVVIDALDECDSPQETINRFLDILGGKAQDLGIRFLIASRPEPAFAKASGLDAKWSHTFFMQDIPPELARQDVSAFLTAEWSQSQNDDPQRDWPTREHVEHLALVSDGLFIYASTAWKFVSDTNAISPADRVEEVLALGSVPSGETIDNMYDLVLTSLWKKRSGRTEQELTRRCLQAVICLYEPLSVQNLSLMLAVKVSHVWAALRSLQSVLRVPRSGETEPVSTFHASFADYLMDFERSGDQPWHIDVTTAHRELYLRSWDFMKRHLQFNVSGSSNSYLWNEEQPELKQPSGALAYACLRWVDHLSRFQPSLAEMEELQTSFSTQYLFWLEMLSVLKQVQEGQRILIALSQRMRELAGKAYSKALTNDLQDNGTLPEIDVQSAKPEVTEFEGMATRMERLATEAKAFIVSFAIPISTSAPHIYISALSCANLDSVVTSASSGSFQRLPNIVTKQARHALPMLTLLGHTDKVDSVALSPDGQRAASGSADNTIWMWDVDTGAQIGEPFRGHTKLVRSVGFSPDGKRIVSGSKDKTIRMWDVDTGSQIGEALRGHTGSAWSVAFSPDGKRVASGSSDKTIRMWDVNTGAQIGEPLCGHTKVVRSVAVSPCGKRVVSGSDDHTIRMWDVDAGAQIGEPLCGHTESVYSVAFSLDGKRFASGSRDKTIQIWDINSGAEIGDTLRGHTNSVFAVAFTPDGKYVASGSGDSTIRIWDVDTGAQIGEPLLGHTDWVRSVVFSRDGKRVTSGSSDHTIRIWELDAAAHIGEAHRGHTGLVWSVSFSPDGKRIASGSTDDTIRMWDVDTGVQIGEPLYGHGSSVTSVTFSPNGKRVASGSHDNTIRMWDAHTGAQIGEPLCGHTGWVRSVAFSPDGERVASGSADHTILMWKADTGVQIGKALQGHTNYVSSVAFSPDGKRVASGSGDKTLRIWDVDTGAQIGEPLRGHTSLVLSVAFSPNGKRIASGSYDNTICLWAVNTGTQTGEKLCGHTDHVQSVMFSPDGKWVASGSSDHTIRMWDVETGAQFGEPLRGHTAEVSSVAFSHNGKCIASASEDHTIRIWDLHACIKTGKVVDSEAFSPRHSALMGDDAVIQSAARNQPLLPPFAALPELVSFPGLPSSYNFGLDHNLSLALQDGWIRGPNDELMFWVLPEYRSGLWCRGTLRILGAHPVKLDLGGCPLGEDWMQHHQPQDAHAPHSMGA